MTMKAVALESLTEINGFVKKLKSYSALWFPSQITMLNEESNNHGQKLPSFITGNCQCQTIGHCSC